MPKHAGGRPSKLTPDVQEQIVRALRAGNYLETAARYAGCSKVIVYDWIKRGQASNHGKYREFLNAIEKAQADAEARDIAIISKAADKQWQAAAWRLERKFPDRWGNRQRLEVKHETERPLVIDLVTNRAQLAPTDSEANGDDGDDA